MNDPIVGLIQFVLLISGIAILWQLIVWAVAAPFRVLGRAFQRWEVHRIVAEYDREQEKPPNPSRG